MKKRKKTIYKTLAFVALCLFAAYYFADVETACEASAIVTQQPDDIQYELVRTTDNRAEQVIEHEGYTVSYNHDWLVPNWVAYELTADETVGAEERSNKFLPDPLVTGDPVVTSDYKNSGYDRGHMAPAADMKWSEQAMRESFYMTNICPQLHNLNAGDWKDLEEQARDWAGHYGRVYIACGPIVTSGFQTIGDKRKIAVPTAFFKVFLRQTATGWAAVGFVMQNVAGSKPLMTYMQSIDAVEKQTNLDFFYQLPDSIETLVEAEYDVSEWTLPRRK